MRALFSQLSGLTGLLTFLNQLISSVPLDQAIFDAISAGIGVYLVLFVGSLTIQYISKQSAKAKKAEQANEDPFQPDPQMQKVEQEPQAMAA